MSGFRVCISLFQGRWGLRLEGRDGLSVKMLWEEDIPDGRFVPRQRGVREADSSGKCAFGVERHSSVRQGMAGVWSVGYRWQWPSM